MFIPSWGRTHFDIWFGWSTTRLNHLGCISILNSTNCLCPFRKGCFLWWWLLNSSHKVNITTIKSPFRLGRCFVGFIFSNHLTIICEHVCAFRILQLCITAFPSFGHALKQWMNVSAVRLEQKSTSLKLTVCPLTIGRAPKGKACLPTTNFQGRAVSFREGISTEGWLPLKMSHQIRRPYSIYFEASSHLFWGGGDIEDKRQQGHKIPCFELKSTEPRQFSWGQYTLR